MQSAEPSHLGSARTHRKRLAQALAFWGGQSESRNVESTKHRLDVAFLTSGDGEGTELMLEGRDTPWRLDLEKEAKRLFSCEKSAVLLWDVAGKVWRASPLGCGCRLCPVCGRARAARVCNRWRAVLEAASADGAVLRHWTLTQRRITHPGGLVTPQEQRKRWVGTPVGPGVVGSAVGGEWLGAAYTRFRTNFRAVRQGRATRERWRVGLGAYLVGVEWTGRGPNGEPSWHVHVHILAVTLPGVEVEVDEMIRDWVRQTGGSVKAQHVSVVDAKAVVEVLKYPFKPALLTGAQRIETLAYARGLHPHHIGGSWHARSADRADPDSCWNRWLSARPPDRQFHRLHFIPDSDLDTYGTLAGEPQLWKGDPSEGQVTWAIRHEGGTGGWDWATWRADAADFARYLGDDPDLGGVELPLEPGSDVAESWFSDL